MLPTDQRCEIDWLLSEVEDRDEVARAVAHMETSQQLFAFASDYNWDNGIAIPTVIADHARCDLATALLLFWRAEAVECFGPDAVCPEYQEAWYDFCKTLLSRLLDGHYDRGPNAFDPDLGRVQRYKLEKRGIPLLLLDPVPAAEESG